MLASRPLFRSVGALVGAPLLGVVVLSATLAPPSGADTPVAEPAASAAGWLAGQLVDGERLQVDAGEFGVFDDPGLTADAVLAFAAADALDVSAAAATEYLTRPETVAGYIGDGGAEAYAGATAKLALVAQVRGLDPTAIAGVDLLERLDGLRTESGRFSDRSQFDFSNVIGQSLAVVVLERAATPAPTAVAVLLTSQCADGGFDLTLEPAPGACESSADPTGFAVEALLASGRTAVDPDVAAALDYLESVQSDTGGFGGDAAAGTGQNANSTGLAALALRSGGRAAAADLAVGFLRSLQVTCTAPVVQRGAIALDAGGFDGATAARATAQAILGLAGEPLATLTAAGASAGAPANGCDPVVAVCAGVTAASFSDVPAANVHAVAIGCLAGAAEPIIAGFGDGTFRPDLDLSRGQVATLLARLLTAAGVALPSGGPTFVDVPAGSTHAAAISALAALGIVAGRSDGTFGPGEPVLRGALATLLARSWPALTGTALPPGPDAFGDDDASVHEPALNSAATLGLVLGTADGTAAEGVPTRRDQAASVVARLAGAGLLARA